MRVFVAGAGGAQGTHLVRYLGADGHEVIGFTLTLGKNLVDRHPIPFGSFVLTFCAVAMLVAVLNGPGNLSRTDLCTGDSISS